MSNQRSAVRWLVWPLFAALLLALIPARARWQLERDHRTVTLGAAYDELATAAAFGGMSLRAALATWQAAGLGAVALDERGLRDLLTAGDVVAAPLNGGVRLNVVTPAGQDALEELRVRYSGSAFDGQRYLFDQPLAALLDVGVGFDAAAITAVQQAGLELVLRPRNSSGLGSADVQAIVTEMSRDDARLVIFGGDQVLGFRDLIPTTAASLAARSLVWGRVEFGAQRGEEQLAAKLLAGTPGQPARAYLRVHGISAPEIARLTTDALLERYRRAVVERGIRLLLVRLPSGPSTDPVAEAATFFGDLRERLAGYGYGLGHATPLPVTGPAPWLSLLLGLLGVVGPSAWLLAWLGGAWRPRLWLTWWLALGLLTAALWLVAPGAHNSAVALLAGLAYPTLAGWLLYTAFAANRPRTVWGAVGALWGSLALVVLGGLVAAGLLGSTAYYLAAKSFAGVKLAHLVPLLAIVALVTIGFGAPGADRPTLRARLATLWNQPVSTGYLLLGAAAFLALALMLLRSGNEGADVSALELRFRALLEHVFRARPRTKEFLLGDPALLLAALAIVWRQRQWAGPLLVLGMVGLVGTFNTFCHLHTPLSQSLLRTFHAAWLSTLLALPVGWWLWGRQPRRVAAPPESELADLTEPPGGPN